MKLHFGLILVGTFTAAAALAQVPVQATAPVTPAEVPVVSKVVQKEVSAANPERVPGYVLGPEDQIIIRAFQADEISDKPVQIQGDGFISLPLVGRVKAGGLSVAKFEAELTKDLSKYIEHPQVTVLVSDYRSQPVSVMGAVNNAGVVQLRGEKSLVQVISLAGGLRTDASNTVTITRKLSEGTIPLPNAQTDPTGRYSFAKVNLRKVMDAEAPQDNIIIKRDDVLTVPKAQMVYVIGEVQKPGGYVLNERDSLSLLQAISLAGGLTKTASAKHAKVLHEVDGKSDRVELPNNVAKILAGKAPDISLHADDILFVPNSTSKTIGLRAAETAVSVGTGLAIWRF
ncbi:MAG TPA: polysaccharide biosynthesis/export family protein [Bryobacteraceae bacterium]|nr:polysaccharide biosynthesis/export family protein [Bryobacteraceae bacterium]